MEKKKCILLWDLLFAAAFALIWGVLWLFSLRLRKWIIVAAAIIIAVGFFAGMGQLISNSEKKLTKIGLSVLLVAICIATIGTLSFVYDFVVPKEHIIASQYGGKFVCHQTESFFSYYGKIYVYKGPFVCGRDAVDGYVYDKIDPFDPRTIESWGDDYVIIGDTTGTEYTIIY